MSSFFTNIVFCFIRYHGIAFTAGIENFASSDVAEAYSESNNAVGSIVSYALTAFHWLYMDGLQVCERTSRV